MRTGERDKKSERKSAETLRSSERAKIGTSADKDALKERVRNMKKTLDAPKYIGSVQDLVPFSWRHPLVLLETDKKMTKVYKSMVSLEKSLTLRDSDR